MTDEFVCFYPTASALSYHSPIRESCLSSTLDGQIHTQGLENFWSLFKSDSARNLCER